MIVGNLLLTVIMLTGTISFANASNQLTNQTSPSTYLAIRTKILPSTNANRDGDLFIKAAGFGDLALIKKFIIAGTDVNGKGVNGMTPLHAAAAGGHRDVTDMLISAGANVNNRDNRYETPLHTAAFFGNLDVAILLMNANANINAKDTDGMTPLHWAASAGHSDIAKAFLDAGAKIDAKNNYGRTPLHWAIFHEHLDLAVMLIRSGASTEELNLKSSEKQQRKTEIWGLKIDIFKIAAWIIVITTVGPIIIFLLIIVGVLIWLSVESLLSKIKSWF